MQGLQRVLKMFGEIKATGANGKTTNWLWDYAREEPTTAEEMPIGSERHKASERARYGYVTPSKL